MAVFDITVYLDTVCPWCYIGHRSLDRAIELYRRTYPGGSLDTFNFSWIPYYLNPSAPSQGIPMLQKIAEKNGVERVNAIRTRLERVGRAYNIAFSFEGKTGNTRDSHRLIRFASCDQQKTLVEKLFEWHFERDGDITSHDMLTRAAVAAGLQETQVRNFLLSEDGGDEVDMFAEKSRQSGVSSVPTVYINGQRLEGAEDVSDFYQAFTTASEAISV